MDLALGARQPGAVPVADDERRPRHGGRAVLGLDRERLLRRRNLLQRLPVDGVVHVARDVDVHYGSVQILFGVDFEVEEGETQGKGKAATNGAGSDGSLGIGSLKGT